MLLALNPDMEGESTSIYLAKLLSKDVPKITRLARGLPMGGDVEYADDITLISAIVAIVIGGIETLALIGDKLALTGAPWRIAIELGENFNGLGFAIIGLFVFCWLASYAIYRWKRFDEIEVSVVT